MKKLFLLVAFTLICVGYRPHVWRWGIHPGDGYLWVKVCEGARNTSFSNNFDSADQLASNTALTREDIMQEVFDDVNQLETTYLKLALYPYDTSNPSTDSNYTTEERTTDRIIEFCNESPGASSGVSSGTASYTTSGTKITKCEIKIDPDHDSDAKQWMGVFAHEVGHCIGLQHPQENVHAVMSYFTKGNVHRYQIDDFMGITFLYPNPNIDLKERATYGLKCAVK